ncbi:MAG: aspartate kinase [Myxococcales bacterium]|nr:aspartate kinase [Myxococcales bacterium]
MGIIVQKYGGSSVATPDQISAVARRITETRQKGHSVVVVVSAMGNTTDELLQLANQVSLNPPRRELDMLLTVGERISMALLSMAIHELGYPAVSFTGSQSGIITTDNHTNARIIRVTPVRIQQALAKGQIVIVAGFQGVSERLEITSLGRGGSDTTAVALAAALDADYVEICSDVDGVYSGDPRRVAGAKRIEQMSYEHMQTLADAGAKVLNAEAVEWARRNGIEIRCASTHGPQEPGTRVRRTDGLDHPRVIGVTKHPGLVYLGPTDSGIQAPDSLENILVAHGASNAVVWRFADTWAALVPRQNIHGIDAFKGAISNLSGILIREDLTLVSIIGRSLTAPPAILPAARDILSQHKIEIHGQALEPNQVGFLVDATKADLAVSVLHDAVIGSVN